MNLSQLRHRLVVLLSLFAVLTAGCNIEDEDPIAAPEEQASYLALGDSYTIGEGVSTAERFPVQLADALRQRGVDLASPRVIARTGWRSDNLAMAIADADLPTNSYDLVSLLIGVNDQFQGRDLDDFRQNLSGLLDETERIAKQGADGVLVISIPDYSVTPFARNADTAAIRRELDLYNAEVAAAATQRAMRYINITPISREARDDASLLAPDGLHPSALMYSRWVADLVRPAEQILAQ